MRDPDSDEVFGGLKNSRFGALLGEAEIGRKIKMSVVKVH